MRSAFWNAVGPNGRSAEPRWLACDTWIRDYLQVIDLCDGAAVRNEGLITLVCAVPEHTGMDLGTLKRMLESRLEARMARADRDVELTASMLECWVVEELQALVGGADSAGGRGALN